MTKTATKTKTHKLGAMGAIAYRSFNKGERARRRFDVDAAERVLAEAEHNVVKAKRVLATARHELEQAETLFANQCAETIGIPWQLSEDNETRWVCIPDDSDEAVLTIEKKERT